MLRSVATGARGESFRLYAPDDALLFSNLDARRPGFERAVEIAQAAGFVPVTRLAGGHAAVFLQSSVAFAWASPDPESHLNIQPRFERLTGWIVDALQRLGLDARVGEVPGEYCPGEYSVNIAGQVKVMGVGQRVIRGGAHVGGVLTVAQSEGLREILIPIYEALDLEFRPETAGGVADFDATLTPDRVIAALVEAIEASGHDCETAHFGDEIERAAEALVPMHGPRPARNPGAAFRAAAGGKALLNPDADPTA